MNILSYRIQHREAIVRLSLRAWAPVFASLEQTMRPELYRAFYPDWRIAQRKAVENVCDAEDIAVHVAVMGEAVVGFVAVKEDHDEKMGEIYMIAVDPDAQREGVGVALSNFAMDCMRDAGMLIAMVETGGDPGHAPARHTYEKAGFDLFPVARYFKVL